MIIKKNFRIILIVILTVFMLSALFGMSYAEISSGDFQVTGTGWRFDSGILYIESASPVTISTSVQTTHRVIVTAPVANVTISGINIKAAVGSPPISVGADSTLNLTVNGQNTLDMGKGSFNSAAGIELLTATSNVVVNGTDSGTLSITCGYYGAGIGSIEYGVGGNITINGSSLNITSYYGAGIGGGRDGDVGNITINGGILTISCLYAAGIGAGNDGDCGDIILNGGTYNIAEQTNGIKIGAVNRSFRGNIIYNLPDSTTVPYTMPYAVTGGSPGVDYVYSDLINSLIIKSSQQMTISMAPYMPETDKHIEVVAPSANITINGVRIKPVKNNAPLRIGSGSTLNLTLTGTSIFDSTKAGVMPSIHLTNVNSNAVIGGTGSASLISSNEIPGIGSDRYKGCGNITINGGTITASATSGAAIGSAANMSCGNITINGGTVTASSNTGAAIGSGRNGTVGNITVSGGTFTLSSLNAEKIGKGVFGKSGSVTFSAQFLAPMSADMPFSVTGGTAGTDYTYNSATKILSIIKSTSMTIKNKTAGTVTESTIETAAAIANITINGLSIKSPEGVSPIRVCGGSTLNLNAVGENEFDGTVSIYTSGIQLMTETANIAISGNGKITAKGGTNSAGIGSVHSGAAGNITLSGADIVASSTSGAAIGSGYSASCANITIKSKTLKGTSNTGAGIGTGELGSCGDILISARDVDLSVVHTGSNKIGKGLNGVSCGKIIMDPNMSGYTVIGGTAGTDYIYDVGEDILRIITSTALEIKNMDINVPVITTIEAAAAGNVNLTVSGVNTVTNYAHTPLKVANNTHLHLTVKNTNTLDGKANINSAGVQLDGENSNITIKGTGTLNATGGRYGAGIGTARDGVCGKIKIESGTINALLPIGAEPEPGGSFVLFPMKGSEKSGAGIGSGLYGSCKEIIISGGVVTGYSTKGAGIGSGSSGSFGRIDIMNAVVKGLCPKIETSTGPDNFGAGIGSGAGSSAKNDSIEISTSEIEVESYNGAGIGSGHNNGYVDYIRIISSSVTAKTYSGAGIGTGLTGGCGDIYAVFTDYDVYKFTTTSGVHAGATGYATKCGFVMYNYSPMNSLLITGGMPMTDYMYDNYKNTVTIFTDTPLEISNYPEIESHTSIRVTAKNAVLTLAGLNITTVDSIPLTIEGGASLDLRSKAGTVNRFETPRNSFSSLPVIYVKDKAALTMGGEGRIVAINNTGYGASAIGSSYRGEPGGDITINSGEVYAQSRTGGIGVGTGDNLIINGGFVEAVSERDAAIGSYYECKNITINGGTVKATTTDCSVGIGMIHGSEGVITINGGDIEASVGSGNGPGHDGFTDLERYIAAIGGRAKKTVITGGKIKAVGYHQAAGIGGIEGDVDITGGDIEASGGTGAGIGGRRQFSGGRINISGGKIKASSTSGAGIGSGEASTYLGYITIDNAVINSTSTNGAGIGSGAESFLWGGIITINGGKINALSSNGAGIGSGQRGTIGNIVIEAGTINGRSDYGKGIGMGSGSPGGGTLTINGGSIQTPANSLPEEIRSKNGRSVVRIELVMSGSPNADLTGFEISNTYTGVKLDYGSKDIMTDAESKVYLYLPVTDLMRIATSTSAGVYMPVSTAISIPKSVVLPATWQYISFPLTNNPTKSFTIVNPQDNTVAIAVAYDKDGRVVGIKHTNISSTSTSAIPFGLTVGTHGKIMLWDRNLGDANPKCRYVDVPNIQ